MTTYVLRDTISGQYLAPKGAWTNNITEAVSFATPAWLSAAATQYARSQSAGAERVPGTEGSQLRDLIAVPVSSLLIGQPQHTARKAPAVPDSHGECHDTLNHADNATIPTES